MWKLAAIAALTLAACTNETQTEAQSTTASAPEDYAYMKLETMPPAPDGAGGSGCLADGAAITDGVWFGFPTAWDQSEIEFDAACMFSGEAAAQQATARGEESPPPNDFIIVNDSAYLHKIPVGPGARAVRVTHDSTGSITTEFTTYEDLLAKPSTYLSCPGDGCPIWVFVSGGVAVEIAQQYTP